MSPVLVVRQVAKRYGEHEVLRSIDLSVEKGEVACLIGPSGAGKSTLLRCLNFLEKPSQGEITFLGERLCAEDGNLFRIAPPRTLQAARARMPMVFQHFNLFTHRTAIENVMEGPVIVLRRHRDEAREIARTHLARVGMSGFADHYPDQLSGGQKQRVAIARALAMSPALMLLDEPTSALDPSLVREVETVIRDLSAEGMTMVVVSHDMRLVRSIATTVHHCAGGHITASGAPDRLLGGESPSFNIPVPAAAGG